MRKRLEGRIALVTGAARMRGIGRATAKKLAAEGASVIVSARLRDPATFPKEESAAGWRGSESVVAEIEAAGGCAISIDCDVTDPLQVTALFEKAGRSLGIPDAVVNNAGIAGGAGAAPVLDLDDDEWRRTIDVNLNGVYHVCKAAGRAMRAAGIGGAIVNLSSMAGRLGMANYGGYCASKSAVIVFTQQLALEFARFQIRVNCICPGSVDTDMMDSTFHRIADRSSRQDFDGIKAATARMIPLGRQGSPEEQAATIAFLLGPDASYITGQTINVDGGVRMD